MAAFQRLANEYPDVSLLFSASVPTWSVWPSRHTYIVNGQQIPGAPGAQLHIEQSAGQAAECLLSFSGDVRALAVKTYLNPARDPWFNADDLEPWQFWLYSIREFWLKAADEAQASDVSDKEFEKIATEFGYCPGVSTAIGQRVWSRMVTRRKSLQSAQEQPGLSDQQVLGSHEEPAGWTQNGEIPHAFKAFAYFCGVLGALRIRELERISTEEGDASLDSVSPERGNLQAPNPLTNADACEPGIDGAAKGYRRSDVTEHQPALNQEDIVSLFPGQEYPKHMYHASKPARIVNSDLSGQRRTSIRVTRLGAGTGRKRKEW